jgi:putative transposase
MTRPLRIQVPGLTYHVHARGNNRMTIFVDDDDRQRFMAELGEILPEEHVACFAYCLMSSHYHLVIRPQLPNLSATLHKLNGTYAQWWNLRHRHVGHTFGGRFAAHVIDADTYFLEACRYVVNNPVASRLVAHASEYRWSSYRPTAGLAEQPAFLDVQTIRAYFEGPDPAAAYARFVEQPASQSFLELMNKGSSVVGDRVYAAQFRSYVEKARGLSAADRRLGRPALDVVLAGSPTQGALAKRLVEAHDRYGYSIGEIAEYLGSGTKSVGTLLRKGRDSAPATHGG